MIGSCVIVETIMAMEATRFLRTSKVVHLARGKMGRVDLDGLRWGGYGQWKATVVRAGRCCLVFNVTEQSFIPYSILIHRTSIRDHLDNKKASSNSLSRI